MHLSYSVIPTPIGPALAVMSDVGLAALRFLDEGEPPEFALETTLGGRAAAAVRDDDEAAPVAAQLREYFDGERRRFDLPLDLESVRGFTRAALEAICDIPYGETAGYGEVAVHAGSDRAGRAVGTACAHTPISVVIPVHRVVRSDGSIGEYGGHPERKRFLLDLEAFGLLSGDTAAP